jgi:hypothetical protein
MSDLKLRIGWKDPATGDVHDVITLREMDGADEDILSTPGSTLTDKLATIVGRCITGSRGSADARNPAPITPRNPRLHARLAGELVIGDLYSATARLGALTHGKEFKSTAKCSQCGTDNKLITNAFELGQLKAAPPKTLDEEAAELVEEEAPAFDPRMATTPGDPSYVFHAAKLGDSWEAAGPDKATHRFAISAMTRPGEAAEAYLSSAHPAAGVDIDRRKKTIQMWTRLRSYERRQEDAWIMVQKFSSGEIQFDATRKPLTPKAELDVISSLPAGLLKLLRDVYGEVEDVSWDYTVPYTCKHCKSQEEFEIHPALPFVGANKIGSR